MWKERALLRIFLKLSTKNSDINPLSLFWKNKKSACEDTLLPLCHFRLARLPLVSEKLPIERGAAKLAAFL
jgi:hypothetical protein